MHFFIVSFSWMTPHHKKWLEITKYPDLKLVVWSSRCVHINLKYKQMTMRFETLMFSLGLCQFVSHLLREKKNVLFFGAVLREGPDMFSECMSRHVSFPSWFNSFLYLFWTWRIQEIHKPQTTARSAGGNSNSFYFRPKNWGRWTHFA